MENQIDIQDEIKLRITPSAANYLLTATRWAKFLAILGFVYSGVVLILAFSIGAIMSLSMASAQMAMAGIPVVFLSFIYIVIAIISFLVAFYMYSFASKCQKGVNLHDEYEIEVGMKAMKTFYMIWGIIAIVGLSIVVLSLFVGIIASAAYSV
ncbi:MAG: hypothetical protein JW717_05975 [Marinilabiliaceae bacterium]|nr:hypothetical protein [Marinilabiliaceae bacterium]